MFPGRACSDGDARDEARLLRPCYFLSASSESMLESRKSSVHSHMEGRIPFSWEIALTIGRGNKTQHLLVHLKARQVPEMFSIIPRPNLGVWNACSVQIANLSSINLYHTHIHTLSLSEHRETTDDPCWLKGREEEDKSLHVMWMFGQRGERAL